MGLGAGYTKHLDETLRSGIYQTQIPNMNFLWESSTTKMDEFEIGDRVCLPDGRVFRYAKNNATHLSGAPGRLVFNANVIPGIDPEHGAEKTGAITLAGETLITDILDTETRAKDYYVGGTCVVFGASSQIYSQRIVKSTAGEGTSVDITLAAGLPFDTTAANQITLYPSIYRNILQTGGVAGFQTAVGCLVKYMAVSAYGWIQTWGECWITPNAWGSTGPGCATGLRDLYVHSNGTIMPKLDDQGLATQRIGNILNMGDGTAYGDGLMMLQLAP